MNNKDILEIDVSTMYKRKRNLAIALIVVNSLIMIIGTIMLVFLFYLLIDWVTFEFWDIVLIIIYVLLVFAAVSLTHYIKAYLQEDVPGTKVIQGYFIVILIDMLFSVLCFPPAAIIAIIFAVLALIQKEEFNNGKYSN